MSRHIVMCWALLALGCQPPVVPKEAPPTRAGHEEPAQEPHGSHEHGEEVPEKEEEVVRLSQAALARSGVMVAPASAGTLQGSVSVPAEVELNPNRVAHISALVSGQLLEIGVEVGAKVNVDQALATLRSVALGQARAELQRASALRDVARKTLARQKKLRAEGISSGRSLLEAELAYDQANAERNAARSRLKVYGAVQGSGSDMTLTSPIAGRVVQRHATRGENVSPEDNLFMVADLSKVWIMGRVYEQQISSVVPGMRATLSLHAYPGRTWSGEVDFMGSLLDPGTRTLPIRVELENSDGMLRPGMFGSLRLDAGVVDAPEARVVVPDLAIQTLENREVVFLQGEAPGVFEPKVVTTGRRTGGQVEVLSGLEPGAPIVVKGAFVLKSELLRSQLGHGHAH